MSGNSWPGIYHDRRAPAGAEVELSFGPGGLDLRHRDGSLTIWPYWSIEGLETGGGIRLARKGGAETVIIHDPAFGRELRAKFPALLEKNTAEHHAVLRFAAITFAVVAALALALWMASGLIGRAAVSLVPRAMEEKLGEAVVGVMAPESRRCKDPDVQKTLEPILESLTTAAPSPYSFRLYVVDDAEVNAFAAPGGYIMLNRGLIEKTRRPEEVAGVLAHEMQHVLLRHGTAAMMRGLGIRVALAALLGDTGWIGDLAGTLGELHFLRQDEDRADQEGIRTLFAARLDPTGMVDLLKTLDRQAGDVPGSIKYLSTHPQTSERIEHMEQMARSAKYVPRRLPRDGPWPPHLESCRSGDRP